ncbi:MAG: ureidoglycolate lyase [Candidatus Eremiobacteraeota bacterium]|nr:ureidoglycolate lyase [Candidatus Eremiobacteraeota bacterium]
MKTLKPEPLTREAFAPYGEVIEAANAREVRTINYGNTRRFHHLAGVEVGEGKALLSIFRSTPLPRPIPIKVMEMHPLGSQAFVPLSNRPYLVVVAGQGEFQVENLRVFLAGPQQGVNYHQGCWHHYSLALDEVSDFLVIDRDGPGENCLEVFLDEEIVIDY